MPNIPQGAIDSLKSHIQEVKHRTADIMTDPRYLDAVKSGHLAFTIGNEMVFIHNNARQALQVLDYSQLSKDQRTEAERVRRQARQDDDALRKLDGGSKVLALRRAASILADEDEAAFYTEIKHLNEWADKLRKDLDATKPPIASTR